MGCCHLCSRFIGADGRDHPFDLQFLVGQFCGAQLLIPSTPGSSTSSLSRSLQASGKWVVEGSIFASSHASEFIADSHFLWTVTEVVPPKFSLVVRNLCVTSIVNALSFLESVVSEAPAVSCSLGER